MSGLERRDGTEFDPTRTLAGVFAGLYQLATHENPNVLGGLSHPGNMLDLASTVESGSQSPYAQRLASYLAGKVGLETQPKKARRPFTTDASDLSSAVHLNAARQGK